MEAVNNACQLLRSSNAPLSINLSYQNVDDEGLKQLSIDIRVAKQPFEIDLCNNDMTSVGIARLSESLKHVTVPFKLDLGENNINAASIKMIATCLTTINVSFEISISNNNIGDSGLAEINKALPKIKQRFWIDASNNNITGKGAKDLARAIRGISVPFSINLYSNKIDLNSLAALTQSLSMVEHPASLNVLENVPSIFKVIKNITSMVEQSTSPIHLECPTLTRAMSRPKHISKGVMPGSPMGCTDDSKEITPTMTLQNAIINSNNAIRICRELNNKTKMVQKKIGSILCCEVVKGSRLCWDISNVIVQCLGTVEYSHNQVDICINHDHKYLIERIIHIEKLPEHSLHLNVLLSLKEYIIRNLPSKESYYPIPECAQSSFNKKVMISDLFKMAAVYFFGHWPGFSDTINHYQFFKHEGRFSHHNSKEKLEKSLLKNTETQNVNPKKRKRESLTCS